MTNEKEEEDPRKAWDKAFDKLGHKHGDWLDLTMDNTHTHTPCYSIYNDNCLQVMNNLISKNNQFDLILTDPPYNMINGLKIDSWENKETAWDSKLPTKVMFERCEKLLRPNGALILFSQEPYTSELRTNFHKNLPFLYPSYWFKNHFANPFTCKKAPVSYVEDLSIFRKKYDVENTHPLRLYAQELLEEMGETNKSIERVTGNRKHEHFFYKSTQFAMITKESYNDLINYFHIDKLPCYKPYEELEEINNKYKPRFNIDGKFKSNVYDYKKESSRFHPTQKPIALLEDLIKTYTNKGETVLDFTMGSGSTGIACLNMNRKFIGIELDETYYTIAKKRLEEANNNTKQTTLIMEEW